MSDLVKQLRARISDESASRVKLDNAAADEIERLRLIEAAAWELIAQKGRHHTEIAYKKLEEVLREK